MFLMPRRPTLILNRDTSPVSTSLGLPYNQAHKGVWTYKGTGEGGQVLAETLGFGMRGLFTVSNTSLPSDTADPGPDSCVLRQKQGQQGYKAFSACQEVWA